LFFPYYPEIFFAPSYSHAAQSPEGGSPGKSLGRGRRDGGVLVSAKKAGSTNTITV
jgi:hypothetical protein